LLKSYVDLILLVSDQSEYASFKEGAQLYEKCEQLSGQLMTTLGSVGNAWDVINNSAIGEFGSLERSPAIAAYAGLLSLHSQMGDPTKVMTAALIADISILDLSPRMTQKIRRGEAIESLHAEDQQAFQNHPISSLNKALSRKLQIPDEVKNIILCSHERSDQKGFPNRPRPEKIPQESMLIHISEMIDRASLIRMGEARPQITDIKKQIFEEQSKDGRFFSLLFLEKIRGALHSL
jgi:response regulator RpfG family c-di-GMP phosphodiesterase